MTDEQPFRKMSAELSHDGVHVTLRLVFEDGTVMGECVFPPSQGYKLAQNITIQCMQCEDN